MLFAVEWMSPVAAVGVAATIALLAWTLHDLVKLSKAASNRGPEDDDDEDNDGDCDHNRDLGEPVGSRSVGT